MGEWNRVRRDEAYSCANRWRNDHLDDSRPHTSAGVLRDYDGTDLEKPRLSRTRNDDEADMKPELEDEAAPNETGVPSLQRAPRSNPSCPGIFEHPADFCRRANGLFPNGSANRSRIAIPGAYLVGLGWSDRRNG